MFDSKSFLTRDVIALCIKFCFKLILSGRLIHKEIEHQRLFEGNNRLKKVLKRETIFRIHNSKTFSQIVSFRTFTKTK